MYTFETVFPVRSREKQHLATHTAGIVSAFSKEVDHVHPHIPWLAVQSFDYVYDIMRPLTKRNIVTK